MSSIIIPLNMSLHDGETSGDPGYIYLLHFDTPYKGCRHYLGFTTDVDSRLQRHQDGHGNKLVHTVLAQGTQIRLVRVWQGCRNFERKLKNQKNAHRFCPVCKETKQ